MSSSPSPPRRIVHVDVDAMFVQCAVMADPERLEGESMILVGGSPTGRGVVTSASYACRARGAHGAMPMATAVRLCPEAIVVPVPGRMVRAKSREIAEALGHWSPIVGMASVDEAYLDLSGTEALFHHEPLADTARRIQADVKRRTGLTVSIGGASNRLVAKLATSFAKPAGVFIVPPGEEDAFLARLELSDLVGVGPALRESLSRRGVLDMATLRSLDVETLTGWFGADRGGWLWRRCHGIDNSPVVVREPTKSVSSETTFRRDVIELAELERALLSQVVQAGASLRKKGLFARTLSVKLRDSEFRDRSRSRTLAEPVQTDRAIFEVTRGLLAELRRQRRVPIRLIGVSLTKLSATADPEQRALLEVAPPIEPERDRVLASAVDRIRAKYGRVIGPGSLGGGGEAAKDGRAARND